jgi:hypothetical protein
LINEIAQELTVVNIDDKTVHPSAMCGFPAGVIVQVIDEVGAPRAGAHGKTKGTMAAQGTPKRLADERLPQSWDRAQAQVAGFAKTPLE